MSEQVPSPPGRLDSWKAIADYLGRDVATVRRWERLHQLPVRRIAGPGRSVFAYVSEIDEWLKRTAPPAQSTGAAVLAEPAAEPRSVRRWALAAAGLVVASGLLWSMPILTSESTPIRAEMISSGIIATDEAGSELWKYPFSPDDLLVSKPPFGELQVLTGDDPGILAATSYHEQRKDGGIRGGQLLWLTPKGDLARSFSFDDQLRVGGERYGSPWIITGFRVDESTGRRRIAISARDNIWWPSIVTVLDETWQRQGTFYNAGWVDQVHWLSRDRLLISGYANAHEGGMVGIIDVNTLNGRSPRGRNPMHDCPACGPESALRYVVLPRSEVNLALKTSLNGAIVHVLGDRILVRTIEFHRQAEAAEVLYEFTPALELIRATYGDRYWEMHASLEAEGKIAHARENCPYRDGPKGMTVWEPRSGWRPLGDQP